MKATLASLLLSIASLPTAFGIIPADKEGPKILGYQPMSPLVLANVSLLLDHSFSIVTRRRQFHLLLLPA